MPFSSVSLAARIPAVWRNVLDRAAKAPSFTALERFLAAELSAGKVVFPAPEQWFSALAAVAPEAVKVVILGQDPYHGPGQAHGLSFSVPRGVALPGSLRNIWKELARDLGLSRPGHGDLGAWTRQGVLLLNGVLTVEAGKAGSHAGKGWEPFTDAIVAAVAERSERTVFLLWGLQAQKKAAMIDGSRHSLLQSVHPSPLSAHRGFIGCGHFSAANRLLSASGKTPIEWAVTD